VSVQTEAGDHVEQSTQVSVEQANEWTQCTVSQTDQSIQAVHRQFPVAVQVTPQTSDTAAQTLPVVAPQTSNTAIQTFPEQAERSSSLPNTVSDSKHNTKSEVDDHYQAEKGSVYSKEVADSSPAKPLMENTEETLLNITEQAERPSLESEDKIIDTESEVVGHNPAEEGGLSIVVYNSQVTSHASAAEPPMKIAETTPSLTGHYQAEKGSVYREDVGSSAAKPPTEPVEDPLSSLIIDYPSSSDEMQPQKEQSSSAVTAGNCSALAVESAAIIPTQTEQVPSQNAAADVPAVVQNQCAPATVSGTEGLQPAALSLSTDTKAVYSFEQRHTFGASNLTLEQSSDIRSQICCGGGASMANVPTRQLVHQTPLHSSSTQALANHTTAGPSVNAEPIVETCSADAVETASIMGSSHADITNESVAAKPLVPISDVGVSDSQLSAKLQRVFSLCTIDRSSGGKSQEQDIRAKKLTSPVSLPLLSVSSAVACNAVSLPGTKVSDSGCVSVINSSQSTARLKELAASESNQQRVPFATTRDIITTAIGARLSGDVKGDSAKFGTGHRYNEHVSESENMAVSMRDQSSIAESASKPTYVKNISVSSGNSGDMTVPGAGSRAVVITSSSGNADMDTRAESGYCNSKELKSTGLDSNQARPSESSVSRGRGRRPLYICRGPLMELGGATLSQASNSKSSSSTGKSPHSSKSPYAKLQRCDSTESSTRKLPAMLMGIYVLFHWSLPSVSCRCTISYM